MRAATAYLARYAAPSRRLRLVLARRIQRWSAKNGPELPSQSEIDARVNPVMDRLRSLGLLDDEAYAAGRARSLARKGWPSARIRLDLRHKGLDGDVVDEAGAASDETIQAQRFAARKRLGPFRQRDRTLHRDKDLRSLLRAGFSIAIARDTVDGDPIAPEGG